MMQLFSSRVSKNKQYLLVFLVIGLVSVVCYHLSPYIGYKVVAFVLLVTVSLTAMFFDIKPVLLSALLSALVWDYFFIPPHFTFHVGSVEDRILLLMYFLIALINAVLTFKIREAEKIAFQKEEKEKTFKLYNTLLNSLSHELRTPIATIIGATDNLQTNENLPENSKSELINEISNASLRLNRQVENLLNMSRLESGMLQLKRDWCDVNELIYEVVNNIKEVTKGKEVIVSIQENMPLFKIDFGLMEQVLYNLIINACTYTKTYIKVQVSYTHIQYGHFENPYSKDTYAQIDRNDDKLNIIIEDDGKGFAENEIEFAFNKFYRLKNAKAGGTGLGLSIVKGFLEAHYGTIELENKSTGGAKFTICIPAKTSYLNNLKNE